MNGKPIELDDVVGELSLYAVVEYGDKTAIVLGEFRNMACQVDSRIVLLDRSKPQWEVSETGAPNTCGPDIKVAAGNTLTISTSATKFAKAKNLKFRV